MCILCTSGGTKEIILYKKNKWKLIINNGKKTETSKKQ